MTERPQARLPRTRIAGIVRVLALLFPVFSFAVFSIVDARMALACPFCSAFSSTLTQDLETTEAAAFGVCVSVPASDDPLPYPKYRFRITEVIKGDAVSGPGVEVTVPSAEPFLRGDQAMLVAVREENLWEWGAVGPLSEAGVRHIKRLPELPKSGRQRMGYFLQLLDSKEELLANDAFNEFAMATIEEMSTVKTLLDRQKVIETIVDPETKLETRRLHWTLLSICGRPEDVDVALDAIRRRLSESEDKVGFDSALSCALVLGGESSLKLIDDEILTAAGARYSDIYSAVLAIRVHGTEFKLIPRERLLESLRLVLNKPQVADLVIPDLARWEDWSQVDRLVELFLMPTEQSQYLKVPVVRYLQVCPTPDAKKALETCRRVDPNAFRRANALMPHVARP